MSTWDFSQFDRDNSNRFNAEAYTSNTNLIAGLLLEQGNDRAQVRAVLRAADVLVGLSERAFAGHRYELANVLAERAYRLVLGTADRVGVPVEPSYAGWEVDVTTPADPAGLEKLPFVVDGAEAIQKRSMP